MAERRYRALLVTNAEFPDDPHGLPPLRGPRTDAEVLRVALTDPRTGLHHADDVMVVADAAKQEVMLALEDFFRDAARDDQLLLYYSGHGQLDLAGRLYLCARDSKADRLMATAIPTRDISDMMDESRARAKVVVLDCCHSGGFKSGADLPQGLAGKGRFVVTSALTSQLTKDADADDAASPFTRFVAEVLATGAPDDDHDGYVSVDDLYQHVTARMRAAGLSTPQRRFDEAVASVAVAKTPTTVRLPEPPARPINRDELRDKFVRANSLEHDQPWLAIPLYREVAEATVDDWSTLAALRLANLIAADDLDTAQHFYRQVMAADHPEWSPEATYRLAHLSTDPDICRLAAASHHPTWAPLAALDMAERIAGLNSPVDTLRKAHSHLENACCATDHAVASKAYLLLCQLHEKVGNRGAARACRLRAELLGFTTEQAAFPGKS
jgi:hypothetical protein